MSSDTNLESKGEFLSIILSSEDSIKPTALLLKDLGENDSPQIEKENIEIRIGQRPIAFSLRDLYEKSHQEPPPDIRVFDSFRIWVIKYVISGNKESGWHDIKQLTFEVSFPDTPRITTLQVFPNTRFIKKFEVDGKLDWVFDVGLSIAGEVSPPEPVAELLAQTDFVKFDGKAKANILLSNTLSVVGNINFSVVTPLIEAIGVAGDYCRWDFHKDSLPLVGDHQMMQVLLVNKNKNSLKFKSRVSVTTTFLKYFPDTRRSEWIDLKAELPKETK